MRRKAFTMKLHKGCEEEYKRRHDELWPEMKEAIANAGASDYSIFLDEQSGTLFAVQKVAGNASDDDASPSPIVEKWWDYMADIMETHADNSPVCTPLREVFHID